MPSFILTTCCCAHQQMVEYTKFNIGIGNSFIIDYPLIIHSLFMHKVYLDEWFWFICGGISPLNFISITIALIIKIT